MRTIVKRYMLALAAVLANLILLIPAASASAFSAGIDSPDSACPDATDKDREAERESTQQAQKPAAPPKPSYKAEDWTVAFYPILAWAPIMGASINLPDLPDIPNLPPGTSAGERNGSVSSGLNGVALFGLSVQKSRFVGDLSVIWGSVGASTANPRISIDTAAIYADASAGMRVYKDLALTGGVRHLGLKINAQLGDRPGVTWKPGVWDPMVGLRMRSSLGKKWGVDLAFEGGGFGVGSDVDISASGRLDWRFARHFGMTMGWGALHFKMTSTATVLSQTYVRETVQTLHGPVFGFGFYF